MSRNPSRLAGVVVTLALLSAACSDSASRITSPAFNTGLNNSNISLPASNFTVLANQAVTCTGGTITGDVGTFQALPTGAVTQTEGCVIAGTVHMGDAAAIAAYKAFVAGYNALAPATGYCNVNNTLTGTLAGVTLPPGIYCISAEAKTGVLTLNGPANGTWTFLVLGALTGTNFSVVMAGGNPCNVTWWVAAAATMTTSNFQGTILAGAGITLSYGTFNGNVFSQADVTVTGTTVTGCAGGTSSIPKPKCNQGVGNGPEGCDPGNSNNHNTSNDEKGGIPGTPGRKN